MDYIKPTESAAFKVKLDNHEKSTFLIMFESTTSDEEALEQLKAAGFQVYEFPSLEEKETK